MKKYPELLSAAIVSEPLINAVVSKVVTVNEVGEVPVISNTPSSALTIISAVLTGIRRVIGKFGEPTVKRNEGGTLSGAAISEIAKPLGTVTFAD